MAYNLRYAFFSNVTEVKIGAKTGLNHHVIEMWIDNPPDPSFVEIVVGRVSVAKFPVKVNDCLFFAPFSGSLYNESFFSWIKKAFGEDIMVEADETEDIVFKFSTAMPGVHVLYREDTEAVRKELPLRSGSEELVLVYPITHSKDINASGVYDLDTPDVPKEYPEIKSGIEIPSGNELHVFGLAFASKKSGTTRPTKFHIYHQRFELFTPDTHEGLSVDPDYNFLKFDINTMDWFKIPEVVWRPGEKIVLQIDAEYDGANTLPAKSVYAFLIGRWRRVR